jgi:arylformamidase
MSALVFQSYSQQQLDSQYDNQAWCPSFKEEMARYRALSADAAKLHGERHVGWGEHPAECLDIYRPATGDALPVVIYVHGGGWLQLGKEDNAFAANSLVDAGCVLVVLGFPNATDVPVRAMVDSVRRGVAWVRRHIGSHGGDPERILLVGHSSGSHLVSQCLTHDWSQVEPAVPLNAGRAPFSAAILASGLGDLEPVRLSYRNLRLHLSTDDVARHSLLRHAPTVHVPVAVVTAAQDTGEFHRQSDDVASYLTRHGMLAGRYDIEHRNHFDVILDLGNPSSSLYRLALRMVRALDPRSQP